MIDTITEKIRRLNLTPPLQTEVIELRPEELERRAREIRENQRTATGVVVAGGLIFLLSEQVPAISNWIGRRQPNRSLDGISVGLKVSATVFATVGLASTVFNMNRMEHIAQEQIYRKGKKG